MRWTLSVAILLAGLAVSALVWWASGGRFALLLMPLIFALPLFGRRRD
jgi:hypothetical protein